MDDSYCDEEFTANYSYCNIHGKPLTVLQADSGDLYINLNDIRHTGFAIFEIDAFRNTLVDQKQIGTEFELHLLSEAKNYIIKNRVRSIDEEIILRTIENCKSKILGQNLSQSVPGTNQRVVNLDNKTITIPNNDKNNHQGNRGQANDSRSYPQAQGNKAFSQGSRNQNCGNPAQRNKSNIQNRNDNGFKSHSSDGNRNRKSSKNQQQHNTSESYFENLDVSLGQSPKGSKCLPSNFMPSHRQVPQGRPSHSKQETRGFSNDNSQSRTTYSTSSSSSSENRKSIMDNFDKIDLKINNTYHVRICYVEPHTDNVCWVHVRDIVGQLKQLMVDIFQMEPTLRIMDNPQRGDLVLGLFGDLWCRGIVIEPKVIRFIDYGNQSKVESCKPLPVSLHKVPALAVRLVINHNRKTLVEDMTFTIKISKKNDDETYLVTMMDDSVSNVDTKIESSHSPIPQSTLTEKKDPVTPKEDKKVLAPIEKKEASHKIEDKKPVPQFENIGSSVEKKNPKLDENEKVKLYFDIPQPVHHLRNGDTVIIVDIDDRKLFIKSKDCIDQAKKINAHIRELDKSELVLDTIKEGQLVLCSKDGMVGLCRGVVTEKQTSAVACVRYIDYPGTDTLSIKAMRNVDEFLAVQPAALLVTSELDILKDLDVQSMVYLTEIIEKKEKIVIEMSDTGEIDFKQQDGKLLSEIFHGAKTDKKESTKVTKDEPVKTDKYETVSYDDMDWIKVDPGIHECICYTTKSASDINLVLQRDDVIEHMELLVALQIQDEKPFKPEIAEMCLVFNEPDGMWERSVAFNINDDGSYMITSVDFGSEMKVTSDQIRRFPPYLKDVPIIGLPCELAGVPDDPKVNDIVKTLIQEGVGIEVKLLKFDEETMKYKIEYDKLTERLKKEGLC